MLIQQNSVIDQINCFLPSEFGINSGSFKPVYSKEKKLIKNLDNIWNKSGIYLITDIDEDDLLYVGQTNNFQKRLGFCSKNNKIKHEVYKNNYLDFESTQIYLNPNLGSFHEDFLIKKFGPIFNKQHNLLYRKYNTLYTCRKRPGMSLSSLTSNLGAYYKEIIIRELVEEDQIYLYRCNAEQNNKPATYVYPKISNEQILDFLNWNTQGFSERIWFDQALPLVLEINKKPKYVASDAVFDSFLLNLGFKTDRSSLLV